MLSRQVVLRGETWYHSQLRLICWRDWESTDWHRWQLGPALRLTTTFRCLTMPFSLPPPCSRDRQLERNFADGVLRCNLPMFKCKPVQRDQPQTSRTRISHLMQPAASPGLHHHNTRPGTFSRQSQTDRTSAVSSHFCIALALLRLAMGTRAKCSSRKRSGGAWNPIELHRDWNSCSFGRIVDWGS